MDFSGIGALNCWTSGCFECTARAVASHLQAQQDWYAFSDARVSETAFSRAQGGFTKMH